jgi:sarcosine oxidase subunit alpha
VGAERLSTRISSHGRLINKKNSVDFTFNGKFLSGFSGDTLASALLANDQMLVGRSFKYHRPRGIVASGPEEPNGLVGLGRDSKFEPNSRVTTTELYEGLEASSQNHWPSLEFDVGVVNNYLAHFLPAGFYYKTFIHPRAAWKHVFEPIIRKSAGLGKAPQERDADRYEHFYAFVDVVVVGGGIAGLQAAKVAGDSGAEVLLIEQSPSLGGRAPIDDLEIAGIAPAHWITQTLSELSTMSNVKIRTRTVGAGVFDHGYAIAYERISDHNPSSQQPRHRLWKIRAKHVIVATGAIERPLSFANNDLPGVMLASSVRDYLINYSVSVGDRTVVVANNDSAYITALELFKAGLSVPLIIDARPSGGGVLYEEARKLGIRIETGKAISCVRGKKRVEGISLCDQAGEGTILEEIPCDVVAMSGGWSPVVHLWSHCGGKLTWNDKIAAFIPDSGKPPVGHHGHGFVSTIGSANGLFQLDELVKNAHDTTASVLIDLGYEPTKSLMPLAKTISEEPLLAVWRMPQGAGIKLKSKTWLDFQNDVKITDVELAAREGFKSVEHAKRYTTLGMATDQGKLSNINGLAILASSLNGQIADVGTTTFRPPYTPISMGSIAGEARDEIFQPLRKTVLHDWHDQQGAVWEPVGHWHRPFCYRRTEETVEQAISREVLSCRSGVGILDASTLGKIIVRGVDAGRFLDMLYTNMMSTLKPGKCRYGLMCSENGFLIDDGVVVRIDHESFLCHTTTGGADRIHSMMEEWLQTEWWDWKVFVTNVTEQYSQIAVVGPRARFVLERISKDDLSPERLPFMGWKEISIGDIDVKIYRISFSGELSYEISVPGRHCRAVWDDIMLAGQSEFITPYGTEALHVMRAEKGFIMIGDESDGTVIPQDLGLDWAISKKKEDYIGKRAHERSHMRDPKRWKLVGLETVDGSVLPEGAYALGEGKNVNGQKITIGRVTSTYYSPTLNKGIALGLVEFGDDRLDEIIVFPTLKGPVIEARIVSPVFYDPNGVKQDV